MRAIVSCRRKAETFTSVTEQTANTSAKTADKNLVCSYGLFVGTEIDETFFDPTWTGRTTTSANPDDVGPQTGLKKRRCMFSASVSAWQTAKSIDASHVQYKESEKEMKSRESGPW